MYRESSRQSLLVVQQVTVISGPKWFFEARCAVLPNFQQAVGKCDSAFTTDAFQTLTNRFRDCYRHAFSSKFGQLLREFVRFLV